MAGVRMRQARSRRGERASDVRRAGQARVTLPAFRQEVQTVTRRRVPGATSARTVCTLGFHRRGVRRWEWDTDMPKPGPLPQTSQHAGHGWTPLNPDDRRQAPGTPVPDNRASVASAVRKRAPQRGRTRTPGAAPGGARRCEAAGRRRPCGAGAPAAVDGAGGRPRRRSTTSTSTRCPDGDTGTNLLLTAAGGRPTPWRADPARPTWPRRSARWRTGRVLGARGNSGVILAQLLRGLAEVAAGAAEADGPRAGRGAARGPPSRPTTAVAEPVEGTMLTVVRGGRRGRGRRRRRPLRRGGAAAAAGGAARRARPHPRAAAGAGAGRRGGRRRPRPVRAAGRAGRRWSPGGPGAGRRRPGPRPAAALETAARDRRRRVRLRGAVPAATPADARSTGCAGGWPSSATRWSSSAPATARGTCTCTSTTSAPRSRPASRRAGRTASRSPGSPTSRRPGAGRERPGTAAVVAVAAGAGLAEAVRAPRASCVVDGGPTAAARRPSIAGRDPRTGAARSSVLPNDAEAGRAPRPRPPDAARGRGHAGRASSRPGRRCRGWPRSPSHDPARRFGDDVIAMAEAAGADPLGRGAPSPAGRR